MTIGEKIKQLREALEITQTELADMIQVSKQTLYKYENNLVTNIPSDKLEMIADKLDTTPEYLMGWEDDPIDYDKLDVDMPTWWSGTIKGYLEYQKALDEDRKNDSIWQSNDIAKDDIERKYLLLCRKAGDVPKKEKEDILKNFEATMDMYLRAKGIKKE